MTFFRGEKGTANSNAVRVLLAGAIMAIFILQGSDPLYRFWDNYIRSRPWIVATVKVVPQQDATLAPRVLYKVDAPYYVTGSWQAWVEDNEGSMICSGNGTSTYGPTSKESVWTWAAFFKNQCDQPTDGVHRICVSYDVSTARGIPGEFGPYCSPMFDFKLKRDIET